MRPLTDFFVPPTSLRKAKDSDSRSIDMALEWLLVGKKLGLSFEEMNELRIRDIALMADIMVGETVTEATQEDIDRLLR